MTFFHLTPEEKRYPLANIAAVVCGVIALMVLLAF